jgi:hypothetical protein
MGRGGVIIVGVAIGGVLLASGCSSGGSGGSGRPVAPVRSGSASGSGSPGSPAVAKVTTESVRVGRLTEIFATPLPADSAQASVVEAFRMGEVLWDQSDEEQKVVSPTTSYVTGAALTNLKASIKGELTPGEQVVPAGVDRNFKTQVTALSGSSATVTTCDDGSKYEAVNPSTGVVNQGYSATADQEYIFVRWQMSRLDGHWAISKVTTALLPSALAKPCQP